MRFTPAKLLAVAEEEVARRRRAEVTLLAACLCGALAEGEDPFLGDTADVDLVLVYNGPPSQPYALVVVHPRVTLEVYAYDRARFEPPRALRSDPDLGATLFRARPLYDPQHFLDYVQAAVRSRFHAPEVAWARAKQALQQARRAWQDLLTADPAVLPRLYPAWLYAAVQVPAALAGEVLPPRRAAPRFAALAHRLGRPEWVADFYRLLGVAGQPPEALAQALAQADEAAPTAPADRARWAYYLAAAHAYARGETPNQGWFPLLWALAQFASQNPFTCDLTARLGWTDPAALAEAADAWLDQLEAFLEDWAQAQGVG